MKHFLFALILVFIPFTGFSQSDSLSANRIILSIGLSGNQSKASSFFNTQLRFGIERNSYLYYSRVTFGGKSDMWTTPDESYLEMGILIGKSFKQLDNLSLAIGIGVVQGIYRGDKMFSDNFLTTSYKKIEYDELGFPIEVNYNFPSFSKFKFGVSLNSNINREYTNYGFSIHIGIN